MSFIGSCHYHCWQETYKAIISDDYLKRLNEQQNILRFQELWELRGEYQYIVAVDGIPMGFFDISKARDPYASYEVQGLYIRKAYHGNGYGRQIISFIKKSINALFYLWCLTTNPTCTFYKHMGTRIVADRNIMIGDRLEKEICFYFE